MEGGQRVESGSSSVVPPARMPAPRVTQALVHAASALTTRGQDANQVLMIDMRPLVIHLLSGLEQAGLNRVVITLGHNASQVADCVQAYGFRTLKIDFIYMTIGKVKGTWSNLASSIIAARAAFRGDEPLLIVRGDQLYDSRLLRKLADAPLAKDLHAFALIDVSPATLRWVDGQFCEKNGKAEQNQALAKVLRSPNGRAVRCGHRLGSYDAVVAGELFVTKPLIFSILTRLFSTASHSPTIADAMQEFAAQGELGCIEVGDLSCHWFASQTLTALFQPAGIGSGVAQKWEPLLNAARELLYSGEWRPTQSMPEPPRRGDLEKRTVPLLQLGSTLGQGANCLVLSAEPGPSVSHVPSRLAVKMFQTGHDSSQSAEVMHEVHVLRQFKHENIVRLCDVVEMTDAVLLTHNYCA